MSTAMPPDLHPIAIVQDRYGGGYAGGKWWAAAHADLSYRGTNRIAWLMSYGSGGNDLEAAAFWQASPIWMAVGDTPEAVMTALRQRGRLQS